MATAKFSSIRAEEVAVLRVLGFGKNGLGFGVRKEATGGNVSVIYSDLFLAEEEIALCDWPQLHLENHK